MLVLMSQLSNSCGDGGFSAACGWGYNNRGDEFVGFLLLVLFDPVLKSFVNFDKVEFGDEVWSTPGFGPAETGSGSSDELWSFIS